jgi:hypothetical protein
VNSSQRMLKTALYQMTRQYGVGPLDFFKVGGSETDLDTGEQITATTHTRIQRAVLLPARLSRDFVNTISKISADKQTVYGGTFDLEERTLLIWEFKAQEVKKDDYFVFNGKRMDVKSVTKFEDVLHVIKVREIVGVVPPRVVMVSTTQSLAITEGTEWTKD